MDIYGSIPFLRGYYSTLTDSVVLWSVSVNVSPSLVAKSVDSNYESKQKNVLRHYDCWKPGFENFISLLHLTGHSS